MRCDAAWRWNERRCNDVAEFGFYLQVRCDMTQEGEKVLIVGDPKELGAWNSLAGVFIYVQL